MRTRAIVNPRAGLAATRALEALRRRPTWEVKLTERPEHARLLASQAVDDGIERVLAVGGDGTLNEVAWGLLGSPCTLGVVPMGSGNGLARMLDVPLDAERALTAIETGMTCRMDVAFANDRPFLNLAGAGFDAVVGAAFQEWGRAGGRRGLWPYFRIAFQHVWRHAPQPWKLESPGMTHEWTGVLVDFFNGRQYGGGATMAPGALLDDGQLDVVHLEKASGWDLLWAAPRLFLGGMSSSRHYHHCAVATAELSSDRPFGYHRDGECEGPVESLRVRVEPKALRVVVPKKVFSGPHPPLSAASIMSVPEGNS